MRQSATVSTTSPNADPLAMPITKSTRSTSTLRLIKLTARLTGKMTLHERTTQILCCSYMVCVFAKKWRKYIHHKNQ